jgi:hypothetical protein
MVCLFMRVLSADVRTDKSAGKLTTIAINQLLKILSESIRKKDGFDHADGIIHISLYDEI